MALAYLLDPCLQYQNRAGVNNVSGYLEVFRMDTDDRATVYVDFSGTLAPEHIGIDNNGRAVMIVESGIPYRVEMHGPNGDLFWTQQPVWTVASGGGVAGTSIISTDGSIAIDESTIGSVTTYDLSSHVEDSTDLLGWVRCDGGVQVPATDIWKPTYTAGTLLVGERGIQLSAGQYYHATARVRITKSAAADYYDDMQLVFGLDDGTDITAVATKGIIVDSSMGLSQDFEISCDVMAESDCELVLEVNGREIQSLGIEILDVDVHRVYSGAPLIPDGVADKPWVEDNYQEKLVAGNNITIDANNVISSTGGASYSAGTGIDITNDVISADTTVIATKADLATKQDVISDLDTIRSGATLGSTAVQPATLDDYVTNDTLATTLADYVTDTELDTILEGYATTTALSTGLATKQDVVSDLSDIRAGAALGATAVQPAVLNDYATTAAMNTALDSKQDLLTAGTNITISDSTISATDTTYTAGSGLDLTGTEFSVDTNTVALKSDLPAQSQLVPGYSRPEDEGKVLTAGSTTYWASLSDYVTETELSTILQGYQEALTAGDNIQISNGTISATDTTYTAGGGLTLNGTEFTVDVGPNLYVDPDTHKLGAIDTLPLAGYGLDNVAYNTLEVDTSVIQQKLTAGSNIQINNNTISATDTTYAAGTGLSLDGTTFSVDTSVVATQTDLAGKQDVISDLSDIRAGAALGATAVQDPDYVHTDNNFTSAEKTKLAGIEAGAEVNVQADWNQTDTSADDYIKNKPTIPPFSVVDQTYNPSSTNAQSGTAVAGAISGVNQVPSSTSSDSGKVLTVDSQGNPEWADAQAPISAGTGIDITNDTVSVDFTEVQAKLEPGANISITGNVISATAEPQVNADWDATSGVAEILNKPTIPPLKELVAGTGITITEDTNRVTISAEAEPQVNADWDATSGVAEILNKPSIPVIGTITV